MRKKITGAVLVIGVCLFAAACGSHPKYYGECHVYVGEGTKYRASVSLYGSQHANSLDGRERLAAACAAVSSTRTK